MALSGTQSALGASIQAKLAALGNPAANDPKVLQIWTAVSEAIIDHLTANAVVIFPPGAITVEGTAAAQANIVPIQASLS